ncbi:BQ2448_5239 [Microbotryum intermedium]|uniref:BQ2448_5239 protein n=1 Tax=Microbotryum intermedium TaxID=269621 RepID=A0A238F8X6_9BASI|nr:BQ2448_5239 [Microbotryum intermedium]
MEDHILPAGFIGWSASDPPDSVVTSFTASSTGADRPGKVSKLEWVDSFYSNSFAAQVGGR